MKRCTWHCSRSEAKEPAKCVPAVMTKPAPREDPKFNILRQDRPQATDVTPRRVLTGWDSRQRPSRQAPVREQPDKAISDEEPTEILAHEDRARFNTDRLRWAYQENVKGSLAGFVLGPTADSRMSISDQRNAGPGT